LWYSYLTPYIELHKVHMDIYLPGLAEIVTSNGRIYAPTTWPTACGSLKIGRRIFHTPEAVDNHLRASKRVTLGKYLGLPESAMARL